MDVYDPVDDQKLFLNPCILFSQKGDLNMRYCPECGGEMHYISGTKRYVCKSCGISLTHQELIEARQQLRPGMTSEEEKHQKQRKEYLKWWLSKKK